MANGYGLVDRTSASYADRLSAKRPIPYFQQCLYQKWDAVTCLKNMLYKMFPLLTVMWAKRRILKEFFYNIQKRQ